MGNASLYVSVCPFRFTHTLRIDVNKILRGRVYLVWLWPLEYSKFRTSNIKNTFRLRIFNCMEWSVIVILITISSIYPIEIIAFLFQFASYAVNRWILWIFQLFPVVNFDRRIYDYSPHFNAVTATYSYSIGTHYVYINVSTVYTHEKVENILKENYYLLFIHTFHT